MNANLQARREQYRSRRSRFRADAKAPFRPMTRVNVPDQDDDSPLLTMCLEVLAGLLLWALFGWGVVAAIAWGLS